MSSKTWLTGLALGAVLALGGATTAKAQNCSADGWQHEQRELNKVINNYGYYSPQAQAQRRKMERLRERCGFVNNGWFRGDGDNDRDDRWVGRRDRDWDHDRWRRGDGDNDRDDRWRRGDGDHDRDDRWVRRHRGDGDHDRDDRRHRDRDGDRDRDRDRD